MTTASTIETLQAELTPWLKELLSSPPTLYRDSKLIREAVHGFIILEPPEISILDSPVVQRLRYIHQTALAYLVYPTARHTRFDHSLGVTAAVNTMARGLISTSNDGMVNTATIRELRLAGLLHDVGHAFFSHLSEGLIKERFPKLFRDIRRQSVNGEARYFQKASEGEMLSYAIITSEPFRSFYDSVRDAYPGYEFPSLSDVAGYIVGQAPDEYQFKADIINGPLDADKLDYLMRDCHFSGIRADVDVERIYYTARILEKPTWPRYLVASQGALPHLEQILFSKMMLYTAIYHHHKVRALECMIRALFLLLKDNPQPGLEFDHVVDFLKWRDFDFINTALNSDVLKSLMNDILDRRLLKRAIVISPRTITPATRGNLARLKEESLTDAGLRGLAQKVYEQLPAEHRKGAHLLWIDVPSSPDLDEDAQQSFVDMGGPDPETLASLFPSSNWLRSYASNKLRAHVFYVADDAARSAAAKAAAEVLSGEFGIVLTPLARQLAKTADD